MAKCGQACPYNTLDGCKVKEYNAICPLTNMVTPITEYQMTNADRIRAMSDEELAMDYCEFLSSCLTKLGIGHTFDFDEGKSQMLRWLKQPAEVE